MADPVITLVAIFLLSFALFTLIAGAFSIYFGAKRTRIVGIIFTLLGLMIFLVYGFMQFSGGRWIFSDVDLLNALVSIIGLLLGFVVSAAIFVAAIIKA